MQPRMEIRNLAADELAIKNGIPKDYYAESDGILILSYVMALNAGDSI